MVSMNRHLLFVSRLLVTLRLRGCLRESRDSLKPLIFEIALENSCV